MLDVDVIEYEALVLSGVFKTLAQPLLGWETDLANDLQKQSIQIFKNILMLDHPSVPKVRAQAISQALHNGLDEKVLLLSSMSFGDKQQQTLKDLRAEQQALSEKLKELIFQYHKDKKMMEYDYDHDEPRSYYEKRQLDAQMSKIKHNIAILDGSEKITIKTYNNIVQLCDLDQVQVVFECLEYWCITQASQMLEMLDHPPLQQDNEQDLEKVFIEDQLDDMKIKILNARAKDHKRATP